MVTKKLTKKQLPKLNTAKKKPFFSVVIPVYNVEKYIKECLDSLVNQGLKPEDYEIIIVNDATPDKSMDVVQKFIKLHPALNVRLINHAKNKGLGPTRNTGIDAASGKYVVLVDPDDYLDSMSLKYIKQRAVETGADVIVTKVQGFPEPGVTRTFDAPNLHEKSYNHLDADEFYLKLSKTSMEHDPTVTYICSREFLNRNNFKFENTFDEDFKWSTKVMLNSKRPNLYWGPYYHYRLRPSSLSADKSFDRAKNKLQLCVEAYELMPEYESREDIIVQRCKSIYKKAVELMRGLSNENRNAMEEMIADSKILREFKKIDEFSLLDYFDEFSTSQRAKRFTHGKAFKRAGKYTNTELMIDKTS